MIPVIVILVYLAIIALIGSLAFRRGKENTEDFFLANRSIGPMVFFLSIFATNMTAFAILGSSGQAYRQGIGIYGLMASSSCFVIPLTLFFIGTRLWAIGKKFGHQTQVSFFRDRWECNHIGTVIFALSAAMLVPYMIISIMGGGTVLADISTSPETHQPIIPYVWGCAIVAVVVTLNVFLGGMRGTVWVNILQTILFLCFGAVAVAVISHALPLGFGDYMQKLAANPKTTFSGHARQNSAADVLELHVDSAFLNHVSAHGHHVFFGAARFRLQTNGRGLSAGYSGHLAAVRFSRRAGFCRAGKNSRSRRRAPAHVAELRAGLAGGDFGRGHYFGRDGFGRAPGIGVEHDVHQGCFRPLWRA